MSRLSIILKYSNRFHVASSHNDLQIPAWVGAVIESVGHSVPGNPVSRVDGIYNESILFMLSRTTKDKRMFLFECKLSGCS